MVKKSQEKILRTVQDEPIVAKSKTPYVFVSHDNRDAELAEEFSKLITSVSLGILRCFLSSDKKGTQGIEYGTEWYPEIMKKLNDASDIVCLLTENSLNRPWILYEAGVAKGKLNNTQVLGIALGIPIEKAYSGPFAQFQNCSDDEDSLIKLIIQLVKRIPNTDPNEENIRPQIKAFIKRKIEILAKKPVAQKEEDKVFTAVGRLFEEVKIMSKDLSEKIEIKSDVEQRRRPFRFHPKFFMELMHIRENDEDIYTPFLILVSIYRHDFPWIYEVGIETYRTMKNSVSEEEISKAMNDFRNVVAFTFHSPISRDMFRSKDDYFFMFEEMNFMCEEISQRIINRKKNLRKTKNKSSGEKSSNK